MTSIGEKAEDIMTTDVVTVKPKDSLHIVSRVLSEAKTSGAPVVDDIGRIVGVISEHDIVAYLSTFEDNDQDMVDSTDLPYLAHSYLQASAKPVEDIMTTGIITAKPDTSIEILARLMTDNNINRIPIVVKGKLVGMVSRIDILRNIGQVDLDKV
ncbi:MAG: CBS domain-containing protein [Methanomassiliicoccales archaeon]|nr:MAG: CBS domain-containing protein [Methanomassiliicoccales archaeon]